MLRFDVGGGVVHAFTLVALWIPQFSLLYEYICVTFIVGGAFSLIAMYRRGLNSSVEHYSAMAMAICSGFFLFHFH